MRFSIYIERQWVEKKANLLAVQEDVKDETLDSASLDIVADDRDKAYEARTYCSITEGGTTKYFRVATDLVSVFSLQPKTYKHSLKLIQTTRDLSHRVLPNMAITKPREKTQRAYFSTTNAINVSYFVNYDPVHPDLNKGLLKYYKGFFSDDYMYGPDYSEVSSRFSGKSKGSRYWSEPFACSTHDKSETAVLRLRFSALKVTDNGQGEIVEMNRTFAFPSWIQPYVLIYHSTTNVAMTDRDSEIENVVEIERIPLQNQVSYNGGYLDINLSQNAIDKINSYNDGYICVDLKTTVVGALPPELDDVQGAGETKIEKESLYDRLFTDFSEYQTNGFQKTMVNAELIFTYKRLFLYDTLQRIIDRQQCEYSQGNKKPLFKLPTSGADYDILTSVESPEFTFTNQTVFEAVSQVLSTIDALPRFDTTKNDDGSAAETLALDYLNARGKEIASNFVSGYTTSLAESKYVNGMVSNYQKAELVRMFPSSYEGNDNYAPIRVVGYGIPELQDFAIVVDKPIKYVKRLEVKTGFTFKTIWQDEQSGRYSVVDCNLQMPIDLSSYAFEESVYSSALSDRGNYENSNRNVRLQINSIAFSQGTKYIKLGNKQTDQWNKVHLTFWNCWKVCCYRKFGIFGQNSYSELQFGSLDPLLEEKLSDEGDYASIRFRCEYASDLDGRLRVESPNYKADGEMNVSASGASIDIGKQGLNMLGVSMRTGVPTMTCNQVISTWNNRILKGQIRKKDGYTWVANKCDYQTIADGIIKGTIEFTRDFNGLAQRIALEQNKRFSNISSNIVEKCEAIVMNYATFYPSFYKKADEGFNDTGNTPITASKFAGVIMKGFGSAYSGEPKNVDFARYYLEPSTSGVRDIYIPLAVYGAGNCVCFETSFDNPISAGIRMEVSVEDNGKWWFPLQQATQSKRYFGKDVKYADSEGYAETVSIDYVMGNDAKFNEKFPIIYDPNTTKVGTLKDLKFRKMPNEIFALNYEIALLSRFKDDREVFFGKTFMDMFKEQKPSHKCYLWFGTNKEETYTMLDAKAKGTKVESLPTMEYGISDLSDDGKSKDVYIFAKLSATGLRQIPTPYYSYAIADENGNLLIGANLTREELSLPKNPYLHFKIDSERIQ